MKKTNDKPRRNVRKIITDLLKEKGKFLWEAPCFDYEPFNFVTQHRFSGMNLMMLNLFTAFKSLQFCTFKQAKEMGAKIIKGSKGTTLFLPIHLKQKDKEEDDDDKSKDKKSSIITFFKSYTVFNISQIENLPDNIEVMEAKTNLNLKPETIKEIEGFVKNTKAKIISDNSRCGQAGVYAGYLPKEHSIIMNSKDRYKSLKHYYGTMFHELVHWTSKALKRKLDLKHRSYKTPSEDYCKEELVAELGASILTHRFGFDYSTQHKTYIKSYWDALNSDEKVLFNAWSKAQKAVNYLLDFK